MQEGDEYFSYFSFYLPLAPSSTNQKYYIDKPPLLFLAEFPSSTRNVTTTS